MSVIKMYMIFCKETLQKMKFEGKLAAQSSHAALHAWWDAEDRFSPKGSQPNNDYWYNTCMPYRQGMDARKIALVVDTVQDLEHIYELYKPYMGATFVEDCAYTVFTENTVTAVGLGPVRDDWFEEGALLKRLETLKREIK